MYICECGRQFEKQSSLNSHARFCIKYVKKTHISIYKKKKIIMYVNVEENLIIIKD